MDAILGPPQEINHSPPQDEQHVTSAGIEEAYANYVTDGSINLDHAQSMNSVTTLLKGTQTLS